MFWEAKVLAIAEQKNSYEHLADSEWIPKYS
jgi:hypothetical protein